MGDEILVQQGPLWWGAKMNRAKKNFSFPRKIHKYKAINQNRRFWGKMYTRLFVNRSYLFKRRKTIDYGARGSK